MIFSLFFFNDTSTTEIYTLSLHDALPIFRRSRSIQRRLRICSSQAPSAVGFFSRSRPSRAEANVSWRSEEHTSELQSQFHLVCRLLLEKKKIRQILRPRHLS